MLAFVALEFDYTRREAPRIGTQMHTTRGAQRRGWEGSVTQHNAQSAEDGNCESNFAAVYLAMVSSNRSKTRTVEKVGLVLSVFERATLAAIRARRREIRSREVLSQANCMCHRNYLSSTVKFY